MRAVIQLTPVEPEAFLRIAWTPPFKRDFQHLPGNVKARAEKALSVLLENPRHASLDAKKMQGLAGVWEARVSISHRITYTLQGDTITLRRIGTHDILKKEAH